MLDPGFDNPLNPNAAVPPDIADPKHESFTYDVDWGDGRDAITGAPLTDINGGPGVLSTATIGGTHVYADDGTYTVKVTVHDDNGGSGFDTFTVTVKNVPPVVIAADDQVINEGQLLDLAIWAVPRRWAC